MEINKMIDHTILKPAATEADIEKLCIEAKENGFASVCINPCNIPIAKKMLDGSDVKVCTVIGFPLGANSVTIKAAETAEAYEMGCDEFDMVINIGALKDGKYDYVRDEIAAVVAAASDSESTMVARRVSESIFLPMVRLKRPNQTLTTMETARMMMVRVWKTVGEGLKILAMESRISS